MNKLVKKIGVASLIIATCCVSTYAKDKVYKLKMATTWGPTVSPLIDAAKDVSKIAEKLSNGRLKIRVDASNKHKSPFGVFDMVKGGQYDLGHSASYFWKGKDLDTLPFTTLPFGLTATEQYAWFYYGGGLELMQKAYAKHGMYSFPAGNTGTQMGGWFRKEIKSLEDLKGLKMRIAGLAGEIWAKLGVNVVNIPGSELYTALERKTIDAAEWTAPYMDVKMGFHKLAPYYYTGWQEPGSELQVLVNKKSFAKLPKDLQDILVAAIRISTNTMTYHHFYLNAQTWSKIEKDYPNIKVKTFPKEVMDKLKQANKEIKAELAKKSAILKEVFESQDAYMKKAREWTKMSEYNYIKSSLGE